MHIVIQVPANHLWSFDADNLIKPLIDGVLGHRKDNWVQGGTWEKEVGDWWAIVTVEPSMRASEPIGEEKSHAHHR